MPLNSAQLLLKSILDQLPLPLNQGVLSAWIQPPNPGEGTAPGLYIWGSTGDETRRAKPRARPGVLSSGGSKAIRHRVDMWLIWLGPSVDPNADSLFPVMVDAVLACLRNTAILDQAHQYTDPVTGQVSDFLNIGENLSWEYAPVRALVDQRYLRYDARISADMEEWFQA